MSVIAAGTLAVGAIGTVIDFANKHEQTIKTGLDVASAAGKFSATNSLVEYTQGARVEPLTIIGADCVNVDFIADVMQSMQTLFSGYYLQAVAMSTQINGVSVTKHLDRLNPNRNSLLTETVLNSVPGLAEKGLNRIGLNLSSESYKNSASVSHTDWRSCTPSYRFRLPTTKNSRHVMPPIKEQRSDRITPRAPKRRIHIVC